MNFANKFIGVQKVYHSLTHGGVDKELDLSDLDRSNIKIVMQNPYDEPKYVPWILSRGVELGADEYEVNIAANASNVPVVSYGEANKRGLMSLDTYLFMVSLIIGNTSVILQFKSEPTEAFIYNVKDVCESFPNIHILVSSLNWRILKTISELWPEVEVFRLNGSPFRSKKAKEFLTKMLNDGKHISISFTFWWNCAKIPIVGLPIRGLVRRKMSRTISVMDVQIMVPEKTIEKTLCQCRDWFLCGTKNQLILYRQP